MPKIDHIQTELNILDNLNSARSFGLLTIILNGNASIDFTSFSFPHFPKWPILLYSL